jgi:hypothetical protein
MNTNDKIRDYFTDDIRTAIREMTDADMKDLLKSLESTSFWIAIIKYNQQRIGVIQDSFLVLDPVKDPSKISQYQGVITGVLDLQDMVLQLKFKADEIENQGQKKKDNKDELGGAYMG